jgi:hypothetical protein
MVLLEEEEEEEEEEAVAATTRFPQDQDLLALPHLHHQGHQDLPLDLHLLCRRHLPGHHQHPDRHPHRHPGHTPHLVAVKPFTSGRISRRLRYFSDVFMWTCPDTLA